MLDKNKGGGDVVQKIYLEIKKYNSYFYFLENMLQKMRGDFIQNSPFRHRNIHFLVPKYFPQIMLEKIRGDVVQNILFPYKNCACGDRNIQSKTENSALQKIS